MRLRLPEPYANANVVWRPRQTRTYKKESDTTLTNEKELKTLEDFGSVLERVRKQAAENGEQAIKNTFKQFFAKHKDEISAVRWRQYAPYFNDGDPCVFSVYGLDVKLTNPPEEKNDQDVEDDDYDEDEQSDDYRDLWDCGKVLNKQTHEAISAIQKQLDKAPEILEVVFGSNSEIVVTPDDLSVEEYYEHD